MQPDGTVYALLQTWYVNSNLQSLCLVEILMRPTESEKHRI